MHIGQVYHWSQFPSSDFMPAGKRLPLRQAIKGMAVEIGFG
jgi:hypothetical protein